MTKKEIKKLNLKIFTGVINRFFTLAFVFVQIFALGLFIFPRPVLANSGSIWLQTSQTDFETGILTNVDIASTPGDVKVATKSDWYDPVWTRRRPILINNQNAELTDHQLKINLTFDQEMQADFDDIRFTTDDGKTPLSYWQEEYILGVSSIFWPKVPSLPSGDSTIYLYYGNPSVSSASSWDNTFAPVGTYSQEIIPTSNTKGLWHFNENTGTHAADSSGNNNTGTLYNNPEWVNGKFIKALSFDGSNDFVKVADSPSLKPGALTITAWIKTTTTDDLDFIVHKYELNTWQGYALRIETNLVKFYTTPGGWLDSQTNNLNDGNWHQIVATFDQNTKRIYIDGKLDSSAPGGTLTYAYSPPLEIGTLGPPLEADFNYNFHGTIDEISIWNIALSSSEIMRQAGVRKFVSTEPSLSLGDKQGSYLPSGILVSAVLNTGTAGTIYKNFNWQSNEPTGTSITWQVRASNTEFNKDNQILDWVDFSPEMTGQYFQWQAILNTTDSSQTPVLQDITLSYNRRAVASSQSATTDEDVAKIIVLEAIDPDNDSLIYSIVANPLHGSVEISGNQATYTPSLNYYGADFFTFKASDGDLESNLAVISLTINPINDPPVLNPIGNQTVDENSLLQFIISATDPDGDDLFFTVSNLPEGAVFETSTSTPTIFSWRPSYEQAGIYSVRFEVSDGQLSDSKEITIIVNNVNRPPVLDNIGNKIINKINEGENLSFSLSASDLDNDALTFSVSDLPDGAEFNTTTTTFSWTPSYEQSGNYKVKFTVSDGEDEDSEEVPIDVGNVNRTPNLNPIGNKSVKETEELSFAVSATDPDDDSLFYSASNLPEGAVFESSTSTLITFSWTPSYEQAGDYSLIFKVSDSDLDDQETITITVSNLNRPPLAGNLLIQPAELKTNDNLQASWNYYDPDEDQELGTEIRWYKNGELSSYINSLLPNSATAKGEEWYFALRPKDGMDFGQSATSSSVIIKNSQPLISPIGDKTINEGENLSFSIFGSDPDNDILFFSVSGLPVKAEFSTSTPTFSWTPNYEQAGDYSLTFKVSDGDLEAEETIFISVKNIALGEGGGGGFSFSPVIPSQVVLPVKEIIQSKVIPITENGLVTATPIEGGETTFLNPEGSKVKLVVPAEAVFQNTNFSIVPLESGTLSQAEPADGLIRVGNYIYDISALSGDQSINSFAKPLIITLTYSDEQIKNLDESTLKIYWWDENKAQWQALDSQVDIENNQVSAQVDHLTIFALIGSKIESVIEKIIAEPVGEGVEKPVEESLVVVKSETREISPGPENLEKFNVPSVQESITEPEIVSSEPNSQEQKSAEKLGLLAAVGTSWQVVAQSKLLSAIVIFLFLVFGLIIGRGIYQYFRNRERI